MTETQMLDSQGMFAAAQRFPEQVAEAAEAARGMGGLPPHDSIDNVVVLGMGGSGVAGDVLAAVGEPFSPVPISVVKDYGVPSFVGPGTLCLAVSFSGDTEETIQAAQTAATSGAHMVVVCRGGELARLAPTWQAPHIAMAGDIPQPRAGLAALAVPLLMVLEEAGLFAGASSWVDAAVSQLQLRRDQLATDRSAEEIARRIGRTVPLIVGGGRLGAVAAQRWKTQVNENPKAPAFAAANPEMCHNEICGWGQHGDMTRQVFTLVELRHGEEHPQMARRFELVRDIMAEVVNDVIEVQAEGEGLLAQLFDLTLVGDFVSLHMAAQEGIDPGPVPVLEDLKAALAT